MAIKTLILGSIFLLTMGVASAAEPSPPTPKEAIKKYVEIFNARTLESEISAVFDFPLVWVIDGKMKYVESPETKFFDYASLLKTGWAYSEVNKLETLSEGPNTAVVFLNFSRFTDKGTELLRSDAFYTLIKRGSSWKIATVSVPSSVPMVKD